MVAQPAVVVFSMGRSLDKLATGHLALVTAYGVRLAGFLLWRDTLRSFQTRRNAIDDRAQTITRAQLASMIAGCSLLYWAMFLPALCSAWEPAVGGGRRAAPAAAGLGIAAAALALEGYADLEHQLYYERGGASPCKTGLWARMTHPNYVGEAAFWWGSWLAGCRGYSAPWQWAAAAAGPAGITWIMWSEGLRRTRRRAAADSGKHRTG
eukprot:scaffold2.g6886.t1